jgi:hypothetical protein
MLKTVSLDLGSLRVIAETSKDLKTGTELERILQESRTRKAVPPPTFNFFEHGETGRGKLSREKPVDLESRNSADVVEGEIQVSVRANRSMW